VGDVAAKTIVGLQAIPSVGSGDGGLVSSNPETCIEMLSLFWKN
jgi:hypothetical protein